MKKFVSYTMFGLLVLTLFAATVSPAPAQEQPFVPEVPLIGEDPQFPGDPLVQQPFNQANTQIRRQQQFVLTTPEPSSIFLWVAVAVGGIGYALWRRRKAVA